MILLEHFVSVKEVIPFSGGNMDNNSPLSRVTNQMAAILAMCLAVAITIGAFILSRVDPDLKLMSLQAVLTLGGTLTGIAGTLLVGVQTYKRLASDDLPSGSSVTTSEQSEVKVPSTPKDPSIPEDPAKGST